VSKVSLSTRISGRATAASVAELDALAAAFAERCETASEPRWEVKHPRFSGLDITGELANAEGIDLKRARAVTLRIGAYHEVRRVVLTADWLGWRADVWGESPTWSRDTAAIVKARVEDLRPWYALFRSFWGSWLLGVVCVCLAIAPAYVYASIQLTVIPLPLLVVLIVIGVVANWVATLWLTPAFRIGPRVEPRAVAGRLSLWLVGTLVAGIVGAVVGVPVVALLT
jgi:hypothetical protein